ncbi:uroporphyrinogen-III synthase [Sphingomonas daechungensis]|uniref:uroporphyrinogen-III synthase n=1 Tax=Sphingomonas daechungensis TaxID=1176646 RepID=UPI0037832341
MRRLFVFRPEPASRQTIVKARALGLDANPIPLFELEALDWSPPNPHDFDGLLLTSANTVKMAGDRLDRFRTLPVHAVGEGTAVAAQVAGLGIATVGSGGVDVLLAEVDPSARLLHLCGEDRREPEVNGRTIVSLPIYRAAEKASVDGIGDLSGQVAVLHSPRAARRLAELVETADRATIRIAAISEATAAAAGDGWEELEVATSPNDAELLALAARLCES